MERLHSACAQLLLQRPARSKLWAAVAVRPLATSILLRCAGSHLWAEKRANREGFGKWEDLRTQRIRAGTQRTLERQFTRDPAQTEICKEIRRLGRERRWEEALELYRTITYPDPISSVTAMDACAKSLQLRPAEQIFNGMPDKTTASFNVMINLFGRLKQVRRAEELLSVMRQDTVEPTPVTMTSLITGYGMVHDSPSVIRVLEEMKAAGMHAGPLVYSAALSACARAGDVASTESLLDRMDKEGVEVESAHLGSMVLACARGKHEERALKAFAEIRRRGFKPDVIAYTCLLSCFSGAEALARADALFAEMLREGVQPDIFAYNALLGVAVSANAPERFSEILSEIESRGFQWTRETHIRQNEMRDMQREAAAIGGFQAGPAESQWPNEAQGRGAAAEVAKLPQQLPPLPAGWLQHVDPASGQTYYWMASDPAGTTTWQRPQ